VTNTTPRGRHRAESGDPVLPPDAAARDAAKRELSEPEDDALTSDGFTFLTRGVTEHEQAAVIAVLTQIRAEETQQVRRVERRDHQPWARSQRVPQDFGDLLEA